MRLDRGQSKVCASVCRPEDAASICSAKDALGFIFHDEIPPFFVLESSFLERGTRQKSSNTTRELTLERSLVSTDDPTNSPGRFDRNTRLKKKQTRLRVRHADSSNSIGRINGEISLTETLNPRGNSCARRRYLASPSKREGRVSPLRI